MLAMRLGLCAIACAAVMAMEGQDTRGLERLHSLVVSHRGQIVHEYYARGHSATKLANIKSASKSVISTLVGIAIERKFIPGVDTPIVRWFPELRADPDTRKQAITIEDLLTMRSGLASTSGAQ